MEEEQLAEALDILKRASKCFELYRVTTFKGYREDKRGAIREVTIEVYDGGPGNQNRYHIVATDSEGRAATGNPDSDLLRAAAMVHWFDLDKERPGS